MKISNEAKIGLMITVVLGMLAYLTFKSGDFDFSKEGYTVKVHFKNIDGVNLNAPVMLNGLEVGKVEKIDIIEENHHTLLELTVWLDQSAKLTRGTNAYVKNMGFLGEKYVGLAVAPASNGYLEPGSIIKGSEPADMDTLLLDGQQIAKQIREITSNVNERLSVNEEAIDRIVGNLDESMGNFKTMTANVNSLTANLDERLRVNQVLIDDTFINLNSSSTNMDQFTYDLKMNPWKLMYRPKGKRQKSIDLLEQERMNQ